MKVIVVGAGIIGCAVAWEFIRSGSEVTLIDDNNTAFQGVSRSGFGSLTPFSDPFFTGQARDHAAAGVSLYRQSWLPLIENDSDILIPFQDKGLLEICKTSDDLVKAQSHADHLNSHADEIGDSNYRAIMMTPSEVEDAEPNLSKDIAGALWMNEPWIDVTALFKGLQAILHRSTHADLVFDTVIKSINSDDFPVTVEAMDGRVWTGDWIVLCTGLHSSTLSSLPVPPLKWIRGDAVAVYTRDNKPLIQRHVYMPSVNISESSFITPRHNGRMLLGATYETDSSESANIMMAEPNRVEAKQVMNILTLNAKILPALVSCDVGEVWRGWRPTPVDHLPILGPLPTMQRVVLATGFIGLGITMAPSTAECIVKYCLEGINSFPSVFSPDRAGLKQ